MTKEHFFIVIALALALGIQGLSFAHSGDNEAFSEPGAEGPSEVFVDEQGKRALGIEVIQVQWKELRDFLQATGEVQAAETQSFDVDPPVPGVVKAVYVKQGDTVSKDQVLAQLHSVEVANLLTQLLNERTRIKSEIERVKMVFKSDISIQSNQVQLAKSNLEREEGLFKEGISARKNLLEAKNFSDSAKVKLDTLNSRLQQEVALLERQLKVNTDASAGQLRIMGLPQSSLAEVLKTGKVMADLPIRAPVAGTIATRSISLGERVDSGRTIFSIVNLDPIWVMVDVFQEQIPKVKVGQQVFIQTPSKQSVLGKISSLGTLVDNVTKTLHVRIIAENGKGILKPGMFVTAQIVLGGGSTKSLIVPESAIATYKDKPYVFVQGDGHFEPVFVRTGAKGPDGIEILEGIKEGDLVVKSGTAQLAVQSTLGGNLNHSHEGEKHGDHHDHEKTESKENSQAVTMVMVFAGGLLTALAIALIWVFVAKSHNRRG